MVAAFSTSGPIASVALIRGNDVVFQGEEAAQGQAGRACLAMLQRGLDELSIGLDALQLFAADLGPGSFTGVRVGIVLAKSLAWSTGKPCAGADAFDLVDAQGVVFLPSRKGEWFVRIPGDEVVRTRDEPEEVGQPRASGFARLSLEPMSPYDLLPKYLIEPSISVPKRDYGRPH